jgi:hypothetical protein
MRDKRFIAEHRGGPLKKEQHIQLMIWACQCVENVLPLVEKTVDQRLTNAIEIAYQWTKGNASVGDARNASFEAIAVANELTDPKEIAIARAVGHVVATAHMSDHSIRAADYALKAGKLAGISIDNERELQNKLLSADIIDLVLSTRNLKTENEKK